MAYKHELNNNRNQSSTSNPNSQSTLFPRVEYEQEFIYEDSKDNFGSASSSSKMHYYTWFHIPQEELYETRRITRAYTKLLGKLLTSYELPRRKETRVEHPNTDLDFYVKSIDDLIETTL